MSDDIKIDFVIPWVDGSDPKWQVEFNKYSPSNKALNGAERYKDWDNLQYIFRAFEQFTPWVNKIHFITWGHIPKWLNVEHPKLNIVKHEDYIPKEFLPTFSANPIELNIHRIEDLSEYFVYFNDDFFILKPAKKEEFFQNRLPVDFAIFDTMHDGMISHMILNDIDLINKNFNRHVSYELSKKNIVLQNKSKWLSFKYGFKAIRNLFFLNWPGHTGFVINHHPQPYLKSILEEVWSKEEEKLTEVSKNKFRTNEDVNQYLFRYWQFVSNKFMPLDYSKYKQERKHLNLKNLEDIQATASELHKYKFYCINDMTNKGRYNRVDISLEDFEKGKKLIRDSLNKILPKKSSYEVE
ncbi:MAG: Stealth CR1 domain-containing protein [Sulfurimonadaceae bacterium]|jgi:hypothetical protein|nr:Stealth CR1 domain-containing protein [Sulfurimonadaceae bacterium]